MAIVNPLYGTERLGYNETDNSIHYAAGPVKFYLNVPFRQIEISTTEGWSDLLGLALETVKSVWGLKDSDLIKESDLKYVIKYDLELLEKYIDTNIIFIIMASSLFLNVLPSLCIVFFLLNTVASNIWQSFVRVFNIADNALNSYTAISKRILNVLILALMLNLTFLFAQADNVSNLQRLEILLTLMLLLIFTSVFHPNSVTLDHIVFCAFITLAATLLILSKDLVTIFFTLELLNMLVIYSFFFNASGIRLDATNSTIKICASCIYQFILNFFSSILLYVMINWYISLTGGAALSNVYLWSDNSAVQAPLSLMLAAFLLKFGSGPWIFFKINIYRNMSYVTVFLYTVVYLTIVLIFFLNLLFIWGVSLPITARNAIIALTAIGAIMFSGLAFQTNNFFIFLSFSSLINITIFLLQAMCVLYV